MTTNFSEVARHFVHLHCMEEEKGIELKEIYVVWFTYVLGGWKALVSTSVEDGHYYEVTHNPKSNETYVDIYKKTSQKIY